MKKIVLFAIALVSLACKPARDDFRFEKIAYHSGPCFGACPSYHLEIRSDRTVLLQGDSLRNKRMGNGDSRKVGYFTAKLDDSSYAQLISELRAVGLDTLRFKGPDCCDAPVKTLIVRYNGKRKYLRAMFPPETAHGLIATLNDIYSTAQFKPTDLRFEIERDSLVKNQP